MGGFEEIARTLGLRRADGKQLTEVRFGRLSQAPAVLSV
jgi:hypothetical protein